MGSRRLPLTFRNPTERWDGVHMAGPGLDAFLDAELRATNTPSSALALVGFSHSTTTSLHIALRRAVPLAAIVGYSGMPIFEGDTDVDAPRATDPRTPADLGWCMATATISFRCRR